jgi:formylglycine-generating enzyme required for sulfatase activity
VGDFWIDRYEATVYENGDCTGALYGAGCGSGYPASFPGNGDWDTPLYACSTPSPAGCVPSASTNWHRAQAACALSGKYLCTNDEWQAAVQGTYDPGSYAGLSGGPCNTNGGAARGSGNAGSTPAGSSSCISRWGAEDMIGNQSEWTAEWWAGGPSQTGSPEGQWPAGYGDNDRCYGIDGQAYVGGGVDVPKIPSVPYRGGSWADAAAAGSFFFVLSASPGYSGSNTGFRCCRRR